jgi:hypothetical protein
VVNPAILAMSLGLRVVALMVETVETVETDLVEMGEAEGMEVRASITDHLAWESGRLQDVVRSI